MRIDLLEDSSDFDSAIPRFESWRPSQNLSHKIRCIALAADRSKANFMLRHVARSFEAISRLAILHRRLHAT
jgi:hypothetical protein